MEHLEFGGLDSYMRNKTTNGCNNGQYFCISKYLFIFCVIIIAIITFIVLW